MSKFLENSTVHRLVENATPTLLRRNLADGVLRIDILPTCGMMVTQKGDL